MLDRGQRRRGGVLDVDERPHRRAAADDRELSRPDHLDLIAGGSIANPVPAVEAAVAQHDALGPGGARDRLLEVADRSERAANRFGGSGSSGSSSVFTGPPTRANGHPAKLWATKRRAPTARPAESRLSVPSVRSRLVTAKTRSRWRGSNGPASAVSWCTITSGFASLIAPPTASASSASATPAVRPCGARSRFSPRLGSSRRPRRPLATSCGTSCLPSAPVRTRYEHPHRISFRCLIYH